MNNFFYYLILIIIFFLGAAIGSFLNCLIYRLHKKRTILGRSFCPNCSHQLCWHDLVPLFSFWELKRRCRYCGQKISWQYPLVELATGLLFLFVFLNLLSQFHISAQGGPASGWLYSTFYILLLRDWVFVAVMIFVFIYDFKYLLIEDAVVVPAIIIIFILNLVSRISLSSLLLGVIISWGIFFFQYFLTKKKGIGEGDLRLGILMGIMFAWPKVIVAVFTSYIIGGFISLFLISWRKKGMKSEIPLGPFLAVGSLITLFFGEQILDFYL